MPVTLGLETLGLITFRLATLRPALPCPEDAVKPGETHLWKSQVPFHRGLPEKITMVKLLVFFKLLGYQGKQAKMHWYVAA